MKTSLRFVTLGLWSLILVGSGQMACSHGESKSDKSEVRVNDEAKDKTAVGEARSDTKASANKAKVKTKKVVKRTEAAADRTAAAVEKAVPAEGSDEEYAADVDATMGDKSAYPTEEPSRTVNPSAVVGTEADNSKVNRLSDGDKGLSADQQGNSKFDVETTRRIRRSITSNKNLSTYAHNIKIITREGRVVLKGPVRSETERKIVEDTAVRVAGIENVTSGLEVKAK